MPDIIKMGQNPYQKMGQNPYQKMGPEKTGKNRKEPERRDKQKRAKRMAIICKRYFLRILSQNIFQEFNLFYNDRKRNL